MVLAVVLTAVALAAIVFVVHREDRGGSSVPPGAVGSSRLESLDREALVRVALPRAVLGYEPTAVREALAAAVRLADTGGGANEGEHGPPVADDDGADDDGADDDRVDDEDTAPDSEQHDEDPGAGTSGGEDVHV